MTELWRLTPDRAGEWRDIVVEALNELQGLFASDWTEWIDRPEDDFRAVLARTDAWAAGRAAGLPLVVGRWEWHESRPRTAVLMAVYAGPAARGSGLAETLVRHLMNRAAAYADGMSLDVVATNRRALRFYHRLGFRPTGATILNPLGQQEVELAQPLARRLAA